MIQWLLDLIFSRGHDVKELARRLGMPVEEILAVERSYHEFTIRKKSGKPREIAAPNPELKRLQRRVLRRLLSRLRVHPLATGFRKRISFVDNACIHQGQAIVIKIDLIDFFPSITRKAVENYFRFLGWNRKSARLIGDLTTYQQRLPQGAPTSPMLSNLINYRLDARLAGLASNFDGRYTRYADDITISFADDRDDVFEVIDQALLIIRLHGYRPHVGRKFDVRRSHQRQVVMGLVVNETANLPREKRRWLRAVQHRYQQREKLGSIAPAPTLTEQQLQGWLALQQMIDDHVGSANQPP